MIDLEEIEARLEAAQHWPWSDNVDGPSVWWVWSADGRHEIAENILAGEATAKFIAHAPTDLRAFVDEIKRLRALVEEMAGALERLSSAARGMPMSHDNLCQSTLNYAVEEADETLAAYRAYKEQVNEP